MKTNMRLKLRVLILAITNLSWIHSSGSVIDTIQIQRSKQQTNEVRFLPTGSIDGLNQDGSRFSSEGFEANGIGVTVTRFYCSDKAAAKRALSQKLKTSTAIIESEILWSDNRQRLGKRVIARFGDKNSGQNTILWTNRNMLFIIESKSFRHSLMLEKSFFPK